MSESELKIAAARLFRSEAWNELKEFGPLKPLDSVLTQFGRELSWSVENTGDLGRIVGKVFSFSRLKSYDDCPFHSFFPTL
jgi:ATP-dependent helicase/nuclease subunit B